MTRETLPPRRRCEVLDFVHTLASGQTVPYTATIGYYDDGRIAEVFLDGGKQSNDKANMARDIALLLSIAIQHGAPIRQLRDACGRDENGNPHTVTGTLLDILMQEETT